MKRIAALMFALLLLPVMAMAETTFDGKVVAGDSVILSAPFGGTVSSVALRAGSKVAAGDEVATIETTKVYAPIDGVITGLFAQEGDSVESVKARWGAVMYILPQGRYTISADIEKAYNSSETKYVNIGETVYLACTTNSEHTAQGVITSASGTTYTVETTSGTLMLQENVNIYRSENLDAKSRIGRGTVGRTKETAVDGSGSILCLHVQDGDAVKRGQLLYETVTGDLDGLYAPSHQLLSHVEGIVASVNATVGGKVNKGDTLITVYPLDALQVEITVNEYDLAAIAQGDEVTITLQSDADQPATFTGTVSMISHLNTAQDGEANYLAYVDFVPDKTVRIGMTAVVTTIDE